MAGVISDNLRNIIDQQEPDLVSSVIQAQPDKAADIISNLEDQGFEYRSSSVGQITIIETNIAPGSLEDLAATDGIERVDHNPTFSIQGTVTDELGDVGGLAEHNLHTLVEYLQPRTEYIVFTAYPAYNSPDASIIDPGEWAVASAD